MEGLQAIPKVQQMSFMGVVVQPGNTCQNSNDFITTDDKENRDTSFCRVRGLVIDQLGPRTGIYAKKGNAD